MSSRLVHSTFSSFLSKHNNKWVLPLSGFDMSQHTQAFLVSVSIQYFSAVVIMLLDMKLGYVVSFFFYLILIGVSINSLVKLFEETTTFDEKIVKNEAILPSFTLCPNQPDDPDQLIKSFEDVTKAIKNVKSIFTIVYTESKPYEETRTVIVRR